ncbi:MAG: hypothetical protein ACRD22_04845 [Terriglobia bacterium]
MSILEPNCGIGTFVHACLERFNDAEIAIGVDINGKYIAELQSLASDYSQLRVFRSDFYDTAWTTLLSQLAEPILVIGNPPWVTNSELSVIGSSNVPKKQNFQNHSGLDAITGKSNFDVSEWMLLRELEWLNGHCGTLAMLCKTSVARKTLCHAWKQAAQISGSDIYLIDAMAHFGAAVDACLLVCDFQPAVRTTECSIHDGLKDTASGTFGFRDSRLISDVCTYDRHRLMAGQDGRFKWRSGIKHDCAEVMELRREGGLYRNGFDEHVELEEGCLYPMLKGSQLANGRIGKPERWMLVTQKFVGEDTNRIRELAPKTWKYLNRHVERFEHRASSIYKGRPPFSMFGVGEYSFALWKVALSAFYKRLDFRVVGPSCGKPVVFDDTCYFVPCQSQGEAELVCQLLRSAPAQEFYNSLIFWDSKRPITADILRHLNLSALAKEVGVKLRSDDQEKLAF